MPSHPRRYGSNVVLGSFRLFQIFYIIQVLDVIQIVYLYVLDILVFTLVGQFLSETAHILIAVYECIL